jgi:hypothetical protein
MYVSPSTSALVDALDAFSQHKLTRKSDLGILLELATRPDAKATLEQLSFTAKFISRTFGIMGRSLLQQAPPGTQEHFASTYYAPSPEALEHHLALLYDLSWYKNWLIDHRTE